MVDPASALITLIIKIIETIKKRAEHVRSNRKDWKKIKGRTGLVEKNLLLIQRDDDELMKNPAVGAAVEVLHSTFVEANELLDKCDLEGNPIRVWWEASKMSKELSRMDDSISTATMDLMAASISYLLACLLQTQQLGFHHLPPEPVGAPGDEMAKQASSMIQEIINTVNQINASMTETVRRNKWECSEVGKRAGKFSGFLSRLENTDMMKDPELGAELEKVVKTFHHAHKLVKACQKRNLVNLKGRKLSKELHQVLDQMVLDLDGMTKISMRYARESREGAATTTTVTQQVGLTTAVMVGWFVTKLRINWQRSKEITHSSGHHLKEASQLEASFEVKEFRQAHHAEEIEALASESISAASSLLNRLQDDPSPSLLQFGATPEAQGGSSSSSV